MSLRDLTTIVGLSLSWGLSAVTFGVFSLAYANGGSIMVAVNQFGEASAELLLLTLVVLPIVTVALHDAITEVGDR